MPEHLRAFVVVVALGFASLWLLEGVLSPIVSRSEVAKWKSAWLLVTTAAFLSNNFWIYSVLLIGIIQWLKPTPNEAGPLFLATAFAVPSSGIEVPGFGLMNYLFEINHARLLSLVLLLPAALKLATTVATGNHPAARLSTDRWVFSFLALTCLLQFRQSTFTDSLRACFLIGLDAFLPYYVISRSIRGIDDIKRLLAAFVMAAGIMGALGFFEMMRVWNLYAGLVSALDTSWGFGGYLLRDGMQRASVSTGQAIVYGYVMAVALGFWLSLRDQTVKGWRAGSVLAVIIAGLVSSLSRGPWLGALIAYAGLILMAPGGGRTIISRGTLCLLAIPLLTFTPWGDKVIGLLPFVGNVDTENIDYRSRLIDNSLIVIERNLFLGSSDYLGEPEMISMMQGQGIVDVVNTYIAVALSYGVIGLFLFFMAFLSAFLSVRVAAKKWSSVQFAVDEQRLARGLVAVVLSVSFMIFTVSSISMIPLVYWTLIAACGAFGARCLPHRLSSLQ